jgi:hypothetical protein
VLAVALPGHAPQGRSIGRTTAALPAALLAPRADGVAVLLLGAKPEWAGRRSALADSWPQAALNPVLAAVALPWHALGAPFKARCAIGTYDRRGGNAC